MKILDKPIPFKNGSIKIHLYHRGHLSIFEKAKVHSCFIPVRRGIKKNDTEHHPNNYPVLIISPIGLNSWDDIWRINISLKDRVGLVHELFSILKRKNINVISEESITRELILPTKREDEEVWKIHRIELIVDATLYCSPTDGDHKERQRFNSRMNDFYTFLCVHFLEDLAFDEVTQLPYLSIKRVGNLLRERYQFHLMSNFDARGQSNGKPTYDVLTTSTYRQPNNQKNVEIKLPESLVYGILEATGYYDPEKDKPSKSILRQTNGYYLCVSDTSERYLKVIFFPKNTHIISPTLKYNEKVGALSEITKSLKLAKFNIVTSLARVAIFGEEARCEFVLTVPKSIHKNKTNSKKIRELAENELVRCLSTKNLIKKYQIGYLFQKWYPDKRNFKNIDIQDVDDYYDHKAKELSDIDITAKSITEKISEKLSDYHNDLIQSGFPVETHELHRNLQIIKTIPRSLMFNSGSVTPIPMFLSYSFSGTFGLADTVRELAEADGKFKVFDASKVFASRTTYQGVISVMKLCKVFLGVWSDHGSKQLMGGTKWWPSPWLHWELGVAQTLNLKWRLLVSRLVDFQALSQISKDTPHIIYNHEGDFREKLKTVIDVLYTIVESEND